MHAVKNSYSGRVKLSKTSCHLHLVFSHKMFSQPGLCLSASDLNLCTHLPSWICGKTASPSTKCVLSSSSAVHVETDELLSEISKISNLLIFSGAMCNIQLYF